MKSFNYHIKAISEVVNQLGKGRFLYYFIPGLVVTAIYFWISYQASSIVESASFLSKIPWIGEYLDKGLSATLSVFGFIFNQIYIFFILTVLSPFNTHLSEKLDSELTGQQFKSGFARIINDLIRMIFIVFLALFIEFFFIGIWWMISGIFGIGDTIYIVFSFLIASFFFGFSFYDHSLERYKIGVFGSLGFAFQNILLVTLTGALFQAIYYFPYIWELPYIGIVLSPVLTTMVATVVYIQRIKKYPKQSNSIIENE